MPQYSVRLEENAPPNPSWCHLTLRVKAVSAKHAMEKAEGLANYPRRPMQYTAKSARRYSTDHSYWRKIWGKAYGNMPTRVHVKKIEDWHAQEPGSTKLPDFIKGVANGTMRQFEGGLVEVKHVKSLVHTMGQQAALTRLLEYAKSNKQHSFAHRSVENAMMRGSRPRTAARRELLMKLASPDGTRIALEMLGQRFQPLKIKR